VWLEGKTQPQIHNLKEQPGGLGKTKGFGGGKEESETFVIVTNGQRRVKMCESKGGNESDVKGDH